MPAELLIGVQIGLLHCPECGFIFGIPKWVFEYRRDNEIEIFCPNGHASEYGNNDEKEQRAPAEVKSLKRQVVKLLHDREQAEAKATDSQKPIRKTA